MSRIDVIKENIQFEQLLNESNTTAMLNEEYLIPDTHPDVEEILMVDANPVINSKETVGEKVNIEGKIEYNVLYLAREDNLVVCSVNYSQKFSNSLDLEEGEHKVICEVDCRVEHIEAKIINERKVAIDGILNINWEKYKEKEIELIKDIESEEGVEMLKKNECVNKTKLDDSLDIIGKSVLRVSMDKPQIAKILKTDIKLHKKETKIGEEKVYCGCYCKIHILYLGGEGKEVYHLNDNVYISKELLAPEITPDMDICAKMELTSTSVTKDYDDLGESRIVNLEFKVLCGVKAFSKENLEVITDAYSPKFPVEVKKENCEMGMIHGIYNNDILVKDNIYIKEEDLKPESIITASGNIIITEKSVGNDRISIEGFLKVCVVYKTGDPDKYLAKVEGEIPFNAAIEALGANKDMQGIVNAALEDLEASIEANTIAVKANIQANSKVLFAINKEIVNDIKESENKEEQKKASITIYVIGEGDKLWDLAKKYKTTMAKIKEMNDLEEDEQLITGEKLLIPGKIC
ncbi:SPOCS domain-containing protein [uncultured Clostridium sp.]|uniref:DUF3794 and LysM peptidoglycan-binding domain-containing protein n=1 Tax=uncultured Clostridium sp. TaxID=59620 RepID=UPI002610144D|nr:SPOCS domain-containing protein [uncultured Clostridium sp.]